MPPVTCCSWYRSPVLALRNASMRFWLKPSTCIISCSAMLSYISRLPAVGSTFRGFQFTSPKMVRPFWSYARICPVAYTFADDGRIVTNTNRSIA